MATSFKLSGDSYIDFGFIDDKKYKGDIKYVDSNRKIGGWTFNSTTVSAGNAKKTFSAFIDSGVTSLSVPEELFSDYHKQIHGAQCEGKICGIPCNATLPDVQVDISGHKVTIKKDLLIFPGADDEGLCMSQVQKALVPGMNILGEPLYMSQYIVHKSANGKQQLGFADHA
ncbi:Type I transmembrane sorting receptor [Ascosphaera atra]|nr:Type I transmembrane sorting receptor [Ascosphaera atra]